MSTIPEHMGCGDRLQRPQFIDLNNSSPAAVRVRGSGRSGGDDDGSVAEGRSVRGTIPGAVGSGRSLGPTCCLTGPYNISAPKGVKTSCAGRCSVGILACEFAGGGILKIGMDENAGRVSSSLAGGTLIDDKPSATGSVSQCLVNVSV
jgi:hypothetical protein